MTRLVDKFCLAAGAAAVLSASISALIASPSFAQTGAATVVVRYSDLKMDAPGAAEVLQRRIEAASAQVCGGQPDLRDLDRRSAFDRCRTEATNRAVGELRVAGVIAPARDAGISPLAHR